MAWKDNSIMFWHDGAVFQKVTDHNRSELSVSIERIERMQRMADGTLRRYVVAKKRTWSCSWDNLPSRRNGTLSGKTGLNTVDGGWAGEDIENFHNITDGSFKMKIRGGDDVDKTASDVTLEEVTVMITSFSKDIVKRGVIDLWNVDIELQEC